MLDENFFGQWKLHKQFVNKEKFVNILQTSYFLEKKTILQFRDASETPCKYYKEGSTTSKLASLMYYIYTHKNTCVFITFVSCY